MLESDHHFCVLGPGGPWLGWPRGQQVAAENLPESRGSHPTSVPQQVKQKEKSMPRAPP